MFYLVLNSSLCREGKQVTRFIFELFLAAEASFRRRSFVIFMSEKKWAGFVCVSLTDIWLACSSLTGLSLILAVFDDGDEKTLRRSSLCLKGARHFAESEASSALHPSEQSSAIKPSHLHINAD